MQKKILLCKTSKVKNSKGILQKISKIPLLWSIRHPSSNMQERSLEQTNMAQLCGKQDHTSNKFPQGE